MYEMKMKQHRVECVCVCVQCNNANVQHQLCINGYAQRNNGVVASIEWIRNAHYFAQFYTYNKVTGIIHITILYDMME